MSDYYGHLTHADGTRTPLSKEEAEALWNSFKEAEQRDAEQMPEPWDATRQIVRAEQRLRKLGWRKGGGRSVRPGDDCAVMESCSTGVWSGYYDADGEWVRYAGEVGRPKRLWLKPMGELSDAERSKMAQSDRDSANYQLRISEAFSQLDEKEARS